MPTTRDRLLARLDTLIRRLGAARPGSMLAARFALALADVQDELGMLATAEAA